MKIWNKKALSPVVAAIIFIVIAITVSIAIVVWMNSLEVEEGILPKQSTIKTYYLGNKIYKSDNNCYYFHGTYNNYLVIGHETADIYNRGRGMSNIYVQINVENIIHIHNVSFKILEIGTDYVIMERK